MSLTKKEGIEIIEKISSKSSYWEKEVLGK